MVREPHPGRSGPMGYAAFVQHVDSLNDVVVRAHGLISGQPPCVVGVCVIRVQLTGKLTKRQSSWNLMAVTVRVPGG